VKRSQQSLSHSGHFTLTILAACVIISICKAYLRHQMCPQRLPEPGKTKLPLGRAQGIPDA